MTVRRLTAATLEALNSAAMVRKQKSQIILNLQEIDSKLASDPFLVMKCNFFFKHRFDEILQETLHLQADPLDIRVVEKVSSATKTLIERIK
jgi:hypothetical protein